MNKQFETEAYVLQHDAPGEWSVWKVDGELKPDSGITLERLGVSMNLADAAETLGERYPGEVFAKFRSGDL